MDKDIFGKIVRGWISTDKGNVEGYCIPLATFFVDEERVKEEGLFLSTKFKVDSSNSELAAIAVAKDFNVLTNVTSQEMLSAELSGRTGQLKTSRGEFKLDIEEVRSRAVAYYLLGEEGTRKGEGVGLQIVIKKSEVEGVDEEGREIKNRIVINSQGKVFVSKNVANKEVKIRTALTYPRVIQILLDHPSELFFNWIGMMSDRFEYFKIRCQACPNTPTTTDYQIITLKVLEIAFNRKLCLLEKVSN